MYKFLNCDEWLSIENAIEPLGAILGSAVKSSNDVLALLFDGKLQGSIHSSRVVAVPLAEMTDEEAKSHRGLKWRKPNGHFIGTISLDDCVMLRATNPVLDVPFFCKRVGDIDFFLDAKERHLDVSRNIRVPPGTLVKTPDKDDYFCVLGGSSIPETFGQIVIRTQAIREFQSQLIELQEAQAKDTATPALVAAEDELTMFATRTELIDAFGKFTDMDKSWFDNLKDAPRLMAARKFTGQGGRHSAEPLFCPYLVMQWMADPKRKKGRKLNDTTAWRLLKSHFQKVYDQYSIGDPNTN
ncbi:MAG: hypothetical protein Q8K22_08430 [Rhodoferax sp.]|nr:hypothetical protein [Rhodoferax sp.]